MKVQILSPTSHDPDVTYNAIQAAINTHDIVRLMPGIYNIGTHCLKVRKAIIIEGLPADATNSATRPRIIGNSGALYTDNTIKPVSKEAFPKEAYKFNCGVFNIFAPGCDVTIKNVNLEHTPDVNPNTQNPYKMHGSSTIAYLVDNTPLSSLTVSYCDLDTAASSGISINATSKSQATLNGYVTNVVMDHCHIVGRRASDAGEAQGGGNFISVKLGDVFGQEAFLDMRNSGFEVTHCFLDAAKWAGVVVARFDSNSKTQFHINDNHFGFNPSAPSAKTRVGLYFMDAARGVLTATNNRIKLGDYFTEPKYGDHSVGLWFKVANPDKNQSVTTNISDNKIYFLQSSSPSWTISPGAELDFTQKALDGIRYEDSQPGGSFRAKAIISRNEFHSSKVPPLRGIYVHTNPEEEHTQPHHIDYALQVYDNDLTALMASHAQVFVDKFTSNWSFAANSYGKLGQLKGYSNNPLAIILCDGIRNKFDEDLSDCDVEGWTRSNPLETESGRFELGKNSRLNEVNVDYETCYWPIDDSVMQVWNRGAGNTVLPIIWVMHIKPPRPIIGPPFKKPRFEISPFKEIPQEIRIGMWAEVGPDHQPAVIFAAPLQKALTKTSAAKA